MIIIPITLILKNIWENINFNNYKIYKIYKNKKTIAIYLYSNTKFQFIQLYRKINFFYNYIKN